MCVTERERERERSQMGNMYLDAGEGTLQCRIRISHMCHILRDTESAPTYICCKLTNRPRKLEFGIMCL